MQHPVIIGISGASGAIYGFRLLQILKEMAIETHLVISDAALRTLHVECNKNMDDLKQYATKTHSQQDIGAPIASGSFLSQGMIIAPCSIRTLSGIAHSYTENLMIRAADVQLKERRKLILMVRETPLHSGHLDLMKKASDWGAIIAPPVPAFWSKPQSLEEMVDQSCFRTLDLLGIRHPQIKRWRASSVE